MKSYPQYKDSQVKWLGQVPQHWEVVRGKSIFSLINERSTSTKKVALENIESFTGNFIPSETIFDGDGVQAKEGDIVYGKLRPYLCKAWLASFDCNAVGDFYVFRCNNQVSAKYIHQVFLSAGFTDICNASTYGAKMPRVSSNFILSLPLPLPPLSEQLQIVDYLEGKVSGMDRFVSLTTQKVETLRALRQATIQQAVTTGIQQNTTLKNTNIKWIPKVPIHWEVKKIKYVFSERSEKGFPEEPVLCSTQKYGVIPQSMYENRVVVVNKGLEGLKLVREGDFVISLRSFQGGIEYAHYQGIISAAYTVLQLNADRFDADADYIKYLFKTNLFIQLLQTCVTGIREGQNINYSMLRKESLPLPPLSEQREIVAYLNEKCAKIDQLIDNYQQQIERIKQLKQALIADVVTGKVDVRA